MSKKTQEKDKDTPIGLGAKLAHNLEKQGVKYDKIYYNGSYEYIPGEFSHMFSVQLGETRRPVCWSKTHGWQLDVHNPKHKDTPQNQLEKLIKGLRKIKEQL